MKKILPIILTIIMLLSIVPMSVFAADSGNKYVLDSVIKESGSVTKFIYDNDAKIKKIVCNYGTKDEYTYATFSYDSKGNLSKEKNIPWNKTFNYNSDFKNSFDKNGNLIKTENSGETIKFTYDSKGRVTKKVYSIDSDSSFTSKYTYDSNNNVIKEFYEEEVLKKYTYNKNGKLIKTDDSRGVIETYTYDKNGNFETQSRYGNLAYTYKYKKVKSGCTPNISTGKIEYHGMFPVPYYCIYSLPKNTYSYTGKSIKPEVIVNCSDFDSYAGYTVKYSNNKNAGKGTIKIDFLDPTIQDITLTFDITPTIIKSLKASSIKKDSIALTWAKSGGAKYYKIKQSTDGKTWKTIKTTDKTSYTVKSLKAGKKYQFTVTALDSSKKVSSKASSILKVSTKK